MSEYFGKYKRPREEIKVIQNFINIFSLSKENYKQKNYQKALSGFLSGYELLTDIFDIYPKIVTIDLIIKSNFHLNKLNACYTYITHIEQFFPILIKYKKEIFIKYKSKIFLYEFILDFICEKLDQSLSHVTEFISYLKTTNIFNLEEKVNFFWTFIKGFIKFGEDLKSKNFLFFKEQYNTMIVEENISKEIFKVKKEKRILKDFVIFYKTFMNSKLKDRIYENLDTKFYFYKYGEFDEGMINFLNRNMDFYLESGNKDKLIQRLKHYLLINKIDLFKKYNIDMNQLIYDQKRRMTFFNTAFLNIVGAFNQIFKNNLSGGEIKLKRLKSQNSMSSIFGKKEILEIEQKLIKKTKITNQDIIKINKEKNNKNLNFSNLELEYKIPPLNFKSNKSSTKKLFFSNERYKKLFNCSYKIPKIINFNSSQMNNNEKNNLPVLKKDDKLIKKLILKKSNKIKIFNLQNKLLFHKIIYKKMNYFLLSRFSEIYEYIINSINSVNDTYYSNNKKSIKNAKINLINLNINKTVKENNFYKLRGILDLNIYLNDYFKFENFILIKNFYLFGLCESLGEFNEQISRTISYLFPSYLNYLIIEYILSKENKDFSELIIQLFKLEELTHKIQDISLLSYINEKLQINYYKYFHQFFSDINNISNIIYEALFYIIKEIKQKNEYQFHSSGFTLCSLMILGKILYIFNIGNTKTLIFNKIKKMNSSTEEWSYKSFSFNKKNKTNKRMILINKNNLNKINEENKENKDIIYNYKISEKDFLLIGKFNNEIYDNIGINFEQEIIKYELNSNDEIIVIGSKGFWNYIDNEEALMYIREYYEHGLSAEEIARLMVDICKKRLIEENKDKEQKLYNQVITGDNHEELIFNDITCVIIFLEVN